MTIEEIRVKAIPILKRHDVEFAGIFGSYARGENQSGSDIDILIRFAQTPGFFGYLSLKESLEKALGRNVDLPTTRSLNKHIRPQVYKDLITIYGRQE